MKTELSTSGFSFKTILPRFFGPGMAFALVIIAIILARHSIFPEKVQVGRHLIKSKPGHLAPSPTAQFLVVKSKESGLSAAQVEKLDSISQAKTRALVPVDLEIKTASERFSEFMKKHESGGLSVLQIQAAGQPLSTASLRKRVLGDKFDEQALDILNSEQKEIALHLWRSAHTAENGSESEPR